MQVCLNNSESKDVVSYLNYRLVNHRRNRFLHEPRDIAGEVWNYCVSYQQWAYKFFGKYIHKYDMMRHVGALRRDVAAFQHWQLETRAAGVGASSRQDRQPAR